VQLERVRRSFTQAAHSFGDFALTRRAGEAEKLAELATADVEVTTWRALDLACGPGTFARAVAKRVRFTVGLDFTPAMLERARQSVSEANPACAFTCGDGSRIPFLDGTFDLALCGYSIHHLLHPRRVIAELARVVRRGGRLAIVDMLARSAAHRAAQTRIERARDRSHTEALTREELGELLRSAGIHVFSEQVEEKTRNFDEWMRVMQAPPGSAIYDETRGLLEATMRDDAAGMRPRIGERGLEYSLPTLFIAGEKR
jgi:ubiquinone/menaquinone biosynthesis C-methylase UbiE